MHHAVKEMACRSKIRRVLKSSRDCAISVWRVPCACHRHGLWTDAVAASAGTSLCAIALPAAVCTPANSCADVIDYEGLITIWDAYTGEREMQLEVGLGWGQEHVLFRCRTLPDVHCLTMQEHEKRAWSVDFSPVKPTCLASGSDDTKGACLYACMLCDRMPLPLLRAIGVGSRSHGAVKIWSTEMEHSVATIDGKANICCVKFNPQNQFHLAFGSAGAYAVHASCVISLFD